MPAISPSIKARTGRKYSRRHLLKQRKTLVPNLCRYKEIESFQRFVDLLDDQDYLVYKQEKARGSLTAHLFPINQKNFNNLFNEMTDLHIRSELCMSVSFFQRDYSHPFFEFCIKQALAILQKPEEKQNGAETSQELYPKQIDNGEQFLDILQELLCQQSKDPSFQEGLHFRYEQLSTDFRAIIEVKSLLQSIKTNLELHVQQLLPAFTEAQFFSWNQSESILEEQQRHLVYNIKDTKHENLQKRMRAAHGQSLTLQRYIEMETTPLVIKCRQLMSERASTRGVSAASSMLAGVIDSIDKIQNKAWILKSFHLDDAYQYFKRIQNDVGQALRVFAELEHSKVESGLAFQKQENKQVVCSLLDYLHRGSKIYIPLKAYNQFVHEKPPRDPILEEIGKFDCDIPGPSYKQLKELQQLNKGNFLSSSREVFNCDKNSRCKCWEDIGKLDNYLNYSLSELNSLYAEEAQKLIERGRAHERAKLVRMSADGYLPELINDEAADQLSEENIKQQLQKCMENQKVIQVLSSRNSGDFDKLTALLKSIAEQPE